MANVLILGAGPAGISAAIYAVRGGLDVKILYRRGGALEKAELIENYYGFDEPITGRELQDRGIRQAQRLGVGFIEDEAVGLDWMDGFTVTGIKEQYGAKAVILSTGSPRRIPPVQNFTRFDGHGISWCAVCDGFMCRGKDVAVLGSGEYSVHEALELLHIAGKVTLLTNGDPAPQIPDPVIIVDERKLASLEGGTLLEKVVFDDGAELPLFRLFTAVGVAGSTELARKVGAVTDKNYIAVNGDMATNVPGLFAAGDCTGGLMQVAKAVYQGAQAGLSALNYVRKLKKGV